MTAKKYKGVIFDLDGTLLDSIEDLTDSVNEAMSVLGYPLHTCAEYKQKVGKGFKNLIAESIPEEKREEATIEKALEYFEEIYAKRFMEKTKPYEGICELLEVLSSSGIKIGVNSNKRDSYTIKLIRHNFPNIKFIDIIGEREGFERKPNPAAALSIAQKMNLSREEILYIGDSGTDMCTGKNAGMDTVGVLWGFRDRKELEENGAVYVAEQTKDIVKMFFEIEGQKELL